MLSALQTARTALKCRVRICIVCGPDLFTQKSPSQRILRLCDFLSDFNFEEIEYVPGAHNVVPDILSRPWDGTCDEVPAAIHVLAACTSRHLRKTVAPMRTPSVVVLPSWQGSVAVQTKQFVDCDNWNQRNLTRRN